MLHANEADKRRLMAGRVTIQELSRRSWWTPCFVVKNSRKTIPLPGTMYYALYVCIQPCVHNKRIDCHMWHALAFVVCCADDCCNL